MEISMTARTLAQNDDGFNINGKKVLAGYWFEWLTDEAVGANRHTWPGEIPLAYNMIIVAFTHNRADGIPTFRPMAGFLTEQQFIDGVNLWKSQGREVLLSLGGAVGHTELVMNQLENFKEEIRRIFNVYGFTGFDLNLENTSIAAGQNEQVLPRALNELKAEFAQAGRKFIITMAPEFPYLRTSGFNGVSYREYLNNTHYDLIFPQYYNQAGDGPFAPNGWPIGNNEVLRREDFAYYLTRALITGSDGFVSWLQIPAKKLALGFPSAPNAAYGDGVFFTEPQRIMNVLDRLKVSGWDLAGVMTWSINQDNQHTARWQSNFDFGRVMGKLLGITTGGTTAPPTCPICPPGPEIIPPNPDIPKEPEDKDQGEPTNVTISNPTANSLTIHWQAAKHYAIPDSFSIYRNGQKVATVGQNVRHYTDTGLTPATTYTYTVTMDMHSPDSKLYAEHTKLESIEPPVVTPPKPTPPSTIMPDTGPQDLPPIPSTYKVVWGDTLSEIAAKFYTTVNHLAKLNHIKNVDMIYEDQILKLK